MWDYSSDLQILFSYQYFSVYNVSNEQSDHAFTLTSRIYMHACILSILWSDLIMQSKRTWQLLPNSLHLFSLLLQRGFGEGGGLIFHTNEASNRSDDETYSVSSVGEEQSEAVLMNLVLALRRVYGIKTSQRVMSWFKMNTDAFNTSTWRCFMIGDSFGSYVKNTPGNVPYYSS